MTKYIVKSHKMEVRGQFFKPQKMLLCFGLACKRKPAIKSRYRLLANWRNSVVVEASAFHLVDLGFTSLIESYGKTLKNGIHSFPGWRSARKTLMTTQ